MINLVKYPIQFLFLVLLQGLVLNNMQLGGYINPYLYPLFILWLPLDLNRIAVLGIAFILGLSVDLFTNTAGMHTSATVFMAFCRPGVLKIIAPRDGYDINQQAGFRDFGWSWFIIYSASLILIHHLFLFFVEIFRFQDFFHTVGRALLSSLFSLLFIMIAQLFRYQPKN